MQENHVFEYAIIRVVPNVEREEFINAGVILYCGPLKFLKTKIALNRERIKVLCADLECEELENYIQSFERISQGGSGSGPIGELPLAERFRWLTATRSTVVQTSKVHPGLTSSPQQMIDRLFEQLVL
jgi:hypothetical protein